MNNAGRRKYLKIAGGALALGGVGVGLQTTWTNNGSNREEVPPNSLDDTESERETPDGEEDYESGPPDTSEWQLSFEDQFLGTELDISSWGIGWGWGRSTSTSPTEIVDENVTVRDAKLRLQGTHDGDGRIMSGAVNTKNKVTFGTGTYFEARLKFADRVGFQNAFWAKPNSEAWPPEIDVVELIQRWNWWEERHKSRHFLHYSTSTDPGDSSTHQNDGFWYQPGNEIGDSLTENFHVYGVEWQDDRIVHYVDGKSIRVWTDSTIMEAMRNGRPFYMMLSLNINNLGEADETESWGEEAVCDWVRVWETSDE